MTVRLGSGAAQTTGARTDPAQTRDAILRAARQRFLHYGYRKTTIDEIASDAGVGKGTVYLYFGGKEDILLNLVHEVKRDITERMRAIAAASTPPEERLTEMVVVRILTVHDAHTATPHGNELVDELRPQLIQCGRAEYDAQTALLAEVLGEGHGRGDLDVPDPVRAAHLLTAAFAAFFPPYFCQPFPEQRTRADLEAGAREMCRFLFCGLRRCR